MESASSTFSSTIERCDARGRKQLQSLPNTLQRHILAFLSLLDLPNIWFSSKSIQLPTKQFLEQTSVITIPAPLLRTDSTANTSLCAALMLALKHCRRLHHIRVVGRHTQPRGLSFISRLIKHNIAHFRGLRIDDARVHSDIDKDLVQLQLKCPMLQELVVVSTGLENVAAENTLSSVVFKGGLFG